MSKYEYTPCPFCKSIVEIDVSWAIYNGRVFCGTCCKSFDVRIGEETESTPPEIPQEPTKSIKEQFDEQVTEILQEEDEYDGSWF